MNTDVNNLYLVSLRNYYVSFSFCAEVSCTQVGPVYFLFYVSLKKFFNLSCCFMVMLPGMGGGVCMCILYTLILSGLLFLVLTASHHGSQQAPHLRQLQLPRGLIEIQNKLDRQIISVFL